MTVENRKYYGHFSPIKIKPSTCCENLSGVLSKNKQTQQMIIKLFSLSLQDPKIGKTCFSIFIVYLTMWFLEQTFVSSQSPHGIVAFIPQTAHFVISFCSIGWCYKEMSCCVLIFNGHKIEFNNVSKCLTTYIIL